MARALGKGFNALFNANENQEQESVQEVNMNECRPNPYQPRKNFDEAAIKELEESIKTHGILQPIIVRVSIKGYEIVVGERRYRAAKAAGLKTIPVVIKKLTEQQMMEIALIENLQREDLSPIEEAEAYQSLLENLNVTQDELAIRLGKSRPHITNHIRLLSLPDPVLQLIANGALSMGHGRALLGLKDKNKIIAVVAKIRKEQLNVRQVEQLVSQLNEHVSRETKSKKQEKDVFIQERESFLREKFGTSVSIKRNNKKGKIEIEFFSQEDLNRILELLQSQVVD